MEDIDESDKAKKTKRKRTFSTLDAHKSLFAQTQTQTKTNGLYSCRFSCV